MKELCKLENPTTTVIIPVADSRFLGECFDSISAQTKLPDEVIVVYNGAEHQVEPELISITKVIVREKKIGPSAARNLGIKESKGDILFFLDADDMAYPHRVEKSIEILKQGRWGLVFGNADLCKPDGIIYKRNDIVDKYSYHLLTERNIIPCASVAVRREVFDATGLFNEDLLVAEDYDMWLRIGKSFHLYQLDSVLMKYRDWEGSQSKTMKHLYPDAERKIKDAR